MAPPPIKLDDLYAAVLDMKGVCERLVAGVLDEDGAIPKLHGEVHELKRQVEILASHNQTSLAKLRDEVLVLKLDETIVGMVTNPPSVLVVDDVPSVVDAICRILDSAGIIVHRATGGEEALAILRSDTPIDVVLSDIHMPGNGTGLLAHVRKDHPRVEVVAMSGYEGKAASYALEHGAHGFLAKPFNGDAVVLEVMRAARFRRIRVGREPSK
jgi:CheY-like chemotaxis protein